MTNPKITDIDAPQFKPGDRLLVRACRLDAQQMRGLQRAVEKWSQAGCRVLVLDVTRISLGLLRPSTKHTEELAGKRHLRGQSAAPGVANISAGVVEVEEGDELLVNYISETPPSVRKTIINQLREWGGKGVVVRDIRDGSEYKGTA